MKTVRLEELIDEKPINGLYKPAEYQGIGNRWVKMKDLYGNMVINDQNMDRVSVIREEERKFSCLPGDLIFGRTSVVLDGVGTCSIVGSVSDTPVFESNLFRVRLNPTKANARFYLYYFRSPVGRAQVLSIARQTAAAQITSRDLLTLNVPFPTISTQKEIALILGALDDKIELNRQMNATLEALARALFQSWFVDFDPVRAKMAGQAPHYMDAATAALFPDSFDETVLGQVPQGWTVQKIKDRAAKIQYGLTQSASSQPIGPHFVRITDIQGGRIAWEKVPYCEVSPEEHEKYRISEGDILVARTGASTGENVYVLDSRNAVFASYLVRFQFSNRPDARIVGEFMRTASYFDYVKGVMGGSAQPNASAQVLANVEMIFPTQQVANAYFEMVKPLDAMRVSNFRQLKHLASIRDTLMPKLLSGELRVGEGERIAEEVL